MCGRYMLIQKMERIERRFNVKTMEREYHFKSYNIAVGQYAPIITNENPREIQMSMFGFTPSFAQKLEYRFNVRAEGKLNPENNPNYDGAKGIFENGFFRNSVKKKRCLVLADAFIEGPEDIKLKEPYLVYLREGKRPFAMAGIWDVWHDKEKNLDFHTFGIITTSANSVLQKVRHHRMPVILHPEDEQRYLNNDEPVENILDLFEQYPAELMNAFPISPEVSKKVNNAREFVEPIGEPFFPEPEYLNVIDD